ncbi:hypothetical protein AAMO2058_000846000 [Amorphochlora amoebiformis]
MAGLIERDLKQYTSRNNRLERQSARIGTASESNDLWDRIEDEMSKNKALSKALLGALKKLPESSEKSNLVKEFGTQYKRFQSIVNQINRRGSMGTEDMAESASSRTNDHMTLQEVKNVQELDKKAKKIKQVYRDVQDLADMFQDVAALVDTQQETVDQITVNVEKAKVHTEGAANEMQQADAYLMAARRRWCIIAIILIILIGVIVGVVLAVTLGNNN